MFLGIWEGKILVMFIGIKIKFFLIDKSVCYGLKRKGNNFLGYFCVKLLK